MSADAPPAATVCAGDSVLLETRDCFCDRVQTAGAASAAVDWGRINPATGPVSVAEAAPGDVLCVRIDRIETAARGVMAVGPDFGVLKGSSPGTVFEVVELDDGCALVAGARVPVRPMIGVIGVAPRVGAVPCGSPGPHGGNLDTKLVAEGTVVYLPVFVPGALLAVGDLHAAMGDGEICGTGVEVRGSVRLTVDVRRDLVLVEPVVETADVVAALASAPTLDEAAERATAHMAGLLRSRLGLSAAQAAMLMSAGGDLKVSQAVNPLRTARFAIDKSLLAGIGPLV